MFIGFKTRNKGTLSWLLNIEELYHLHATPAVFSTYIPLQLPVFICCPMLRNRAQW